jgi:transcriptional regulator with XRE-family HTH domain
MSRAEVARLVKASVSTIQRLEEGDDVSVETIGNVAKLLGVGFDWQTGETTPPPDLDLNAIVRVANEPRTIRRAAENGDSPDPFADLEAVAARHSLTPQQVIAHFKKLAASPKPTLFREAVTPLKPGQGRK